MTPLLLFAALTARDPCSAAIEHWKDTTLAQLDVAAQPHKTTCSKPSKQGTEASLTLQTEHVRITRDGGHERVSTSTAYTLRKTGRTWEIVNHKAQTPRAERYLPGSSIPGATNELTRVARLPMAEHALAIPGSWLMWDPTKVPYQAYELGKSVCEGSATWPEGAVAKGTWRGTVFPGDRAMLLELTPDAVYFAGEPIMALSDGLPYANQMSGRRFIPLFEAVSTARTRQDELSKRLNGCLGPERGQIAIAADIDMPMSTILGTLTTLHYAGINDAFFLVDDSNPEAASTWVPAEDAKGAMLVPPAEASSLKEGEARQITLVVDYDTPWARAAAGLDQAWSTRAECARIGTRVSADVTSVPGVAPVLSESREVPSAFTAALAVLPVHLEHFDTSLEKGPPPMCRQGR